MSDSSYREKIQVLLSRHTEYFDCVPWPAPGSEAWEDLVDTWADAFGGEKVSPGKISKALIAIRKSPPQWKTEHLPELLRLVREAEREQGGPALAPGTGCDAEPPCGLCEGGGFARIYRDDYRGQESVLVGNPDGTRRRVFLAVTAACRCPRGRRMYGSWDAETRKKTIDLDRPLPRGWSFEMPDGPPPPRLAADEQVAPPMRQEIQGMFRKASES